MAGITGCGNSGWMWGQQTDAFPDKTLSQKKWDAYLQEIDVIQEEIRRQVQKEGEWNLQVADEGREKRREIWQEEWERFVVFSKANLERAAKADQADNGLFVTEAETENLSQETQQKTRDKDEWFPYDNMSQDGLTITYNGVTFSCSKTDHTISLGDTSNPKNVIRIPLSKGGTLLVNKNNIADLGRAITMFSTEDIGIILRTIAEFQKAASLEYEMEEDEMNTMERITENSSGVEEEMPPGDEMIEGYGSDSEGDSGSSILEWEEDSRREKK